MVAATPGDPQSQRRAAKRTALYLGVFALALFSLTLWTMVHAA
ncbi:MAG: hypothetical protein ABI588_04570 [Arenimonas sp.]